MKTIDLVREEREKNPSVSATDISKKLGITRSAVGQHLKALGLPGRIWKKRDFKSPLRYSLPITSHNVGAICELQVCADLIIKGFEVFRSVTPHASCDIIGKMDGVLISIEVRASKNGKFSKVGTHDCIASVEPSGEINYHPGLTNFTKIVLDKYFL